jgi:hypothetical protein
VHVPRAMQSVIAHSELMTAAIGAIAPAMIAIGGADILMHIGEDRPTRRIRSTFDINDAQDASKKPR